jgi:hypothetical protein
MYRAVIALSLFLAWNCCAACNVAAQGDTISLVVERDGCLRSDQQRQLFAAQLKQAVRTMEVGPSRSISRKLTAEQLNGFGDLKRQARHLSPAPPVYYGQR